MSAITTINNNSNNKINISNIIDNDPHIDDSTSKHSHKLNSKDLINNNNNHNLNKHPSSWEPLDDLLLRHLKEIKKMGWKEISQYFENRTPNACQFRWRRLKSGNLKSNKTALMDVTEFPGEIKILNPSPTFIERKQKGKEKNDKNKNTIKNICQNKNDNMGHLPLSSNSISVSHTVCSLNVANIDNASNSISPSFPSKSTPISKRNIVSISTLVDTNDQHKISTPSLTDNGEMVSSLDSNVDNNSKILATQDNTALNNVVASSTNSLSVEQTTATANTIITRVSNNNATHDDEGEMAKKFIKPRSYSHSVTSNSMMTPKISINSPQFTNTDDTEKLGFIPKVFVRSRRGSSIIVPSSPPLSSPSSFTSFNTALNTTLNTSKSRKNSFVRRHSLVASTSTMSSRRSSMVVAPNSLPINFNNYQLPTTKNRRESIISRSHKKVSTKSSVKNLETPMITNHLSNHNYCFMDIPTDSEKVTRRKSFVPWSMQEDQLLIENQSRKLSLSELSILLPNRSESDIDTRLHSLTERLNNNSYNGITSGSDTAIISAVSSSNSSTLPTPQAELQEYVSPMHSPKRSYVLNQTDSTMNSQEFKDHLELGRQRATASHSHTSSSKEVTPSTFSPVSTDDSASSTSTIPNSNIVFSDYPTFLKATGQEHSAIVYQNFLGYQQQLLQEKQQQNILPSINSILQRF